MYLKVMDMIKTLFMLSEELLDLNNLPCEDVNLLTNPFESYNENLFFSFKVTTLRCLSLLYPR